MRPASRTSRDASAAGGKFTATAEHLQRMPAKASLQGVVAWKRYSSERVPFPGAPPGAKKDWKPTAEDEPKPGTREGFFTDLRKFIPKGEPKKPS